ncbi:PREDICTED: kelch-like protein 35 [Gekko japonicus]|uniref:Kelch-like protein 35 n=1 Tax=Gekko japonicus TaxID=146911 RepID=A0ABM1KJ09_GEKJA|nr:PREDICTED: kelch-like protein 35 [Gekko japonicus]
MHRRAKEDSGYATNHGAGRNPSLDLSREKLPAMLCHAEQILQALDSYRREGIFTDVVLAMDGQEFPCHRATLSANSAYFRAMFAGGPKEGRQDVVDLRKIPAPAMGLVLDYMYGRNVVVREDNVEGILELSNLLQIPKLQEACVDFLEGHLHPSNCLGLRRFADTFSIPSLAEKSKRVVLDGFVEVSRREEFLDLEAGELAEYLADERLAVPKEEVVFEAAMRWVRRDAATRRGALRDLLECVRLPLLDPCYFVEKVETDKLIRASRECLPLMQEARKGCLLGNEVGSPWSQPRRFTELAEMIVVIGGCDRKGLLKLPFVDMFHPASGQWKPLASMPGCIKSEFAACALKNDVYISGGHIGSRDVWMLSPKLNTWIKVACLRKGRWRHKMAALLGKIYAVGGYDGFDQLDSVECYDSFCNTWTAVASLAEAVSSAAVASCLGRLYVIGGAVGSSTNTEKVQCYNPATNQWSLLSPTPFNLRCMNAITLNNLIYVVGGLLKKIFCYDPRKDTWSEVASLHGPLKREDKGGSQSPETRAAHPPLGMSSSKQKHLLLREDCSKDGHALWGGPS